VITCPDCHAENETGAESCHSCGRALPQVETANAPLPPWLQQLKPEEDAILEEPVPVAARAGATGTDSVIAAPHAPGRAQENKDLDPARDSAHGGMTETASLISEDDLPAWLRAFGEVESQKQAAPADETWMLGANADAANQAASQNLAQSWQSPARPAEARARSGAASVFAKPAEGAAKPDRVITSAAPVETAPEPEPEVRPAGGRLDLPRPTPLPRDRGGMTLQRVALVAFVAALIIFLVVVGIFLRRPALG
jgi:hypothetical protein